VILVVAMATSRQTSGRGEGQTTAVRVVETERKGQTPLYSTSLVGSWVDSGTHHRVVSCIHKNRTSHDESTLNQQDNRVKLDHGDRE
jgi:hypothetical protein